jgi:ubiquinone/menaquinone biosynthesis C-methylase UbiE
MTLRPLPSADTSFAGSIPDLYDQLLVPLIFEPYADDLARRVAALNPRRVLETAAGTGVATRALARLVPATASLVATDLNAPMLARAASVGTPGRDVEWRQADAMQLPFPDASFDVVVCQFGAMFFPDRAQAFAEARRVLRPGGAFVFSTWDRIEDNEFAHAVTEALARVFPADPPRFLARTPHGYHDLQAIERDVGQGGFAAAPQIDTVAARSRAASALLPSMAYCQGTPLRNEIEARQGASLEQATVAAAAEVARRFGDSAVDGRIQARVVTCRLG